MAKKKRSRKGGGSGIWGDPKGLISSAVAVTLFLAIIIAWSNANQIRSVSDLLDYSRAFSYRVSECGYEKTISGNCPIIQHPDGSYSIDESKRNYNPSRENPGITGESGGSDSGNPSNSGDTSASAPTNEEILATLDSLTVEEPNEKADYSRASWKHWTGRPCNTRQNVLISQGSNVEVGDRCKILSGSWYDPYSGKEEKDARKLDIDHVVPLRYANTHGGWQWDKERKEQFANDPSHLLAVSAKENRSKGADGPGKYMPPNKAYRCDYSEIWVKTLKKYDLSLSAKDKNVLETTLQKCG